MARCRRDALLVPLLLQAALLAPLPARGTDDRADVEPNASARDDRRFAWKLSYGRHIETEGPSAQDLNLRANTDADSAWLGHYRRADGFQQTRAGYERQERLPLGRLIASLQLASGGFVGGSLTWEVGRDDSPVYGLLGIGRTNLKPYVNLNFDPNDSTLIGAGWRIDATARATAYQVRDDRLGTGQRVTHLVLRKDLGDAWATSVDVFRRQGRAEPDAEFFQATGLAVSIERHGWFVKLARDPKVNYTASDMTRIAVGGRF